MKSRGISKRGLLSASVGVAALPLFGAAHASEAESLHKDLTELRRFLGDWTGTGEGQPGKSVVTRTYEATLGGRFILARNRSTYAPQEKNPKGEVHDDVGYYSFDKALKRIVLRQFNVEGFVNTYIAATAVFAGDALVLDSAAIENIPSGWRARETYRFTGADAFEEIFELAEPGKDFELYSRSKLQRRRL